MARSSRRVVDKTRLYLLYYRDIPRIVRWGDRVYQVAYSFGFSPVDLDIAITVIGEPGMPDLLLASFQDIFVISTDRLKNEENIGT